MKRTTLRQAIGPASFVLVVLACWFASGMVADRMVQQELDAAMRQQRQMSTSIVYNMAEVIASDLAMSRAIPATMAELGVIQQALAHSQNYAAARPDAESPHRNDLLKNPELAASTASCTTRKASPDSTSSGSSTRTGCAWPRATRRARIRSSASTCARAAI